MNKHKKLQGLYAITSENLIPEDIFLTTVESALRAGVSILQYRDKSNNTQKRLHQASALGKLCERYQTTFIINDDIQLALEVNADGVHIGKDDTLFNEARAQLGDNRIIGVSCYNQLKLAHQAISNGADYIAFGSFFSSRIKPDAPRAGVELISAIKRESDIPVCCIGGIQYHNCQPLLAAGADMLAVISGLFSDTDSRRISHNCQQFIQHFKP